MTELDAVRDLLHRLPQVPPPRSFALDPSAVREPPRLLRFPRLVIWTRAAGAVAAAFFVILFSLDLLGFGNDVKVPIGAQSHAAAPTMVIRSAAPAAAARQPEAPKFAAPGQTPESGAAATESTAVAPAAAPAADKSVTALTATPAQPMLLSAKVDLTPLRLATIGTGALTIALIVATLIAGRQRTRRQHHLHGFANARVGIQHDHGAPESPRGPHDIAESPREPEVRGQ